jgi:hypothetical protein
VSGRPGVHPFRYLQPLELFSSPAVRIGYNLAHRSDVGRCIIRRTKKIMQTGRTGPGTPYRPAPQGERLATCC